MGSLSTIYLADDHPVFLKGLRRYFEEESGFKVVGSSAMGDKALADIKAQKPDVAVIDLIMPNRTGVQIAESCWEDKCTTKIVLLTGTNQTHMIYQAMAAGAAGYLLKTIDWDDLAKAVRRILNGSIIIAPEVIGVLAGQIQQKAGESENALSKREREVLTLIARGESYPEIAGHLHVSRDTVKTHVKNIYKKLDVNNQAAAVAAGIYRGLI